MLAQNPPNLPVGDEKSAQQQERVRGPRPMPAWSAGPAYITAEQSWNQTHAQQAGGYGPRAIDSTQNNQRLTHTTRDSRDSGYSDVHRNPQQDPFPSAELPSMPQLQRSMSTEILRIRYPTTPPNELSSATADPRWSDKQMVGPRPMSPNNNNDNNNFDARSRFSLPSEEHFDKILTQISSQQPLRLPSPSNSVEQYKVQRMTTLNSSYYDSLYANPAQSGPIERRSTLSPTVTPTSARPVGEQAQMVRHSTEQQVPQLRQPPPTTGQRSSLQQSVQSTQPVPQQETPSIPPTKKLSTQKSVPEATLSQPVQQQSPPPPQQVAESRFQQIQSAILRPSRKGTLPNSAASAGPHQHDGSRERSRPTSTKMPLAIVTGLRNLAHREDRHDTTKGERSFEVVRAGPPPPRDMAAPSVAVPTAPIATPLQPGPSSAGSPPGSPPKSLQLRVINADPDDDSDTTPSSIRMSGEIPRVDRSSTMSSQPIPPVPPLPVGLSAGPSALSQQKSTVAGTVEADRATTLQSYTYTQQQRNELMQNGVSVVRIPPASKSTVGLDALASHLLTKSSPLVNTDKREESLGSSKEEGEPSNEDPFAPSAQVFSPMPLQINPSAAAESASAPMQKTYSLSQDMQTVMATISERYGSQEQNAATGTTEAAAAVAHLNESVQRNPPAPEQTTNTDVLNRVAQQHEAPGSPTYRYYPQITPGQPTNPEISYPPPSDPQFYKSISQPSPFIKSAVSPTISQAVISTSPTSFEFSSPVNVGAGPANHQGAESVGSAGSPSPMLGPHHERNMSVGTPSEVAMSDLTSTSQPETEPAYPTPHSSKPRDRNPFQSFSDPTRQSTIPPPSSSRSTARASSARYSIASFTLTNNKEALKMYREQAVKTGDPNVQLFYANYLLQVANIYDDPTSARSTSAFAQAAAAATENNPRQKLVEEAMFWIDKLAKAGNAEACYIKGSWFEDGLYDRPRNPEKAVKFYLTASKGGVLKANLKLGHYYEAKGDINKAILYYKKAASMSDPHANFRMAMICLFGQLGQPQNFKQAMSLLTRAASEATEDCAQPAYVLGLILASDYPKIEIPREHVIPDNDEGLRYIHRASELGYTPALNKLGQYYEYGMAGLQPDPWKSLQYYERAAEKGDAEAMLSMSGWFMSGAEGYFEKNEGLAFKWCERAAEKGVAKAEFALGYYYEVGIGVQPDVRRAIEHYNRAASKGYRNAIERLNRGASVTRTQHDERVQRVKSTRGSKERDCKERDCIVS